MTTMMKNDGTHLKKNDGNSPEVGATVRSCFLVLVNNSGMPITNVTLTHTQGDTHDVITMSKMANGETSYQIQISYETGFWANFDYWNISFSTGIAYSTPFSDYCNISSSDEGQLVKCVITPSSYYNLYVDTPVSDGCNFVIEPVN